MKTPKTLFIFTLLFAVAAIPAQAEQYKDFGDYRVHYNAFNSDILAPEVAHNYGLTRSSYNAIVNITVQRKDGLGGYRAVHATVKGKASDIYSNVRQLKMKEVSEETAIYYLAQLPITDKQKLTFDLTVLPRGAKTNFPLQFEQQFFVK